MIGMTLCSGLGTPELAAPWVDWRFASEIDPFTREVLQQKLGYKLPSDYNQGDAILWDDMCGVTPELLRNHSVPLPNILVAGTPCQSFSIAGMRKGLKDDRGNLTLKFVEICHAIVDAREDGKLVALWENVPGVLSDEGNAFGNLLGAIVGADDALCNPTGESWPSEGMVEGPRGRAAWRVLDAQYFGLAQRRKRVFLVIDFGNGCDPVKVLFERQSLSGNTPPSREAKEEIAGTIDAGIGKRRGSGMNPNQLTPVGARQTAIGQYTIDDTASTLKQRDHKDATDLVIEPGPTTWPAEIAPTLNAAFGDKQGLEDQHALNGAGLFVPIAFDCKGTGVEVGETGISPTLRAMNHHKSHQNGGGQIAVAFKPSHYTRGKDGAPSDIAPPLTADADKGDQEAVVFSIMPQNSGKDYKAREVQVSQPILSGGPGSGNQGGDFVVGPTVRRIMPIECARLQGCPDDHLDIIYRGKPAKDGNKYKAWGNGMAKDTVEWIMDRIRIEVGA